MKLYHGSNVMIEHVDFSQSHPFKDFGCGFYLTDNLKHARNMATRRMQRAGGQACVTTFEFDLEAALNDLKVKIFERPCEEWAEFVMLNRNEEIPHPAHDYDIVIGPIADDSVAISFLLFKDGFITISELIRLLEYRELSIQYFFHNDAAVSYLKRKMTL